jgi:IS4 transposase
VLTDRIVRVRSLLKHTRKNPLDHDLWEVLVVIEAGETLRLVTNDLVSPAETIADLYKTRWEIELFFRWIKQTLKIRKPSKSASSSARVRTRCASKSLSR